MSTSIAITTKRESFRVPLLQSLRTSLGIAIAVSLDEDCSLPKERRHRDACTTPVRRLRPDLKRYARYDSCTYYNSTTSQKRNFRFEEKTYSFKSDVVPSCRSRYPFSSYSFRPERRRRTGVAVTSWKRSFLLNPTKKSYNSYNLHAHDAHDVSFFRKSGQTTPPRKRYAG